jgi:hypothetical protein
MKVLKHKCKKGWNQNFTHLINSSYGMSKVFLSKTLRNNIFNFKIWGIKSDDVSYHHPLSMEDHLSLQITNYLKVEPTTLKP